MRFPDAVTVVARDRDTGLPAEGVAIVLVLFAKQKNNYTVGPLISNESGEANFTRAECEFAIKRAQEMFIMDYQGDLESCRPMIEVSLHSPEHIERMRQQYETSPDFWGRGFHDPKRLFTDLQSVKNADYELTRITATEAQVLTNPQLELPLVKRAA
jgi:hypothetical protein